MDYTWNIICPVWFSEIKNWRWSADMVAINILADIAYWHKPTMVRDESTWLVLWYKNKFKADKLQKSYWEYAKLFWVSKDSITRSFDKLEKMWLVFREFRNISVNGRLINNVMFLSIDEEAINMISKPKSTPLSATQGGGYGQLMGETPPSNAQTNTDSTTDSTTYILSKDNKSDDLQKTSSQSPKQEEKKEKEKSSAKKEKEWFGCEVVSDFISWYDAICKDHWVLYEADRKHVWRFINTSTWETWSTKKEFVSILWAENCLDAIDKLYIIAWKIKWWWWYSKINSLSWIHYNWKKIIEKAKTEWIPIKKKVVEFKNPEIPILYTVN